MATSGFEVSDKKRCSVRPEGISHLLGASPNWPSLVMTYGGVGR